MVTYAESPQFLKRSTPYPQGPFTTGCFDLLIGKDYNGSLTRIFYPTDEENIKLTSADRWTRWDLGREHHIGFVKKINEMKKCSDCYELNFIEKYFYEKFSIYAHKNILIPSIWEAPFSARNEFFPVIIFSHGLGANRSLYSSICNNIASYGFLVAAVEHRDESAAATFTLTSDGEKQWIIYKEFSLSGEFTDKQLEIRTRECSRALDVLTSVNEGFPIKNLLESSFDLKSLKGKLDLSKPGMAGHSFGGAIVIEVLEKDKRFQYGLSLDPWMFPLASKAENLAKKIRQPILFILMEKFQSEKNMNCLKLFLNERNEFYTIKSGLHLHQTDTAMIFANDWTTTQKTIGVYSNVFPPEVPLTINNVLMLKFILEKLGRNFRLQADLEIFLKSQDEYILPGIHGTAESMIGWGNN